MKEILGFQNPKLLHSFIPSEILHVCFCRHRFNNFAALNSGSADDCSTHFSRGG